MHDKNHAFDWLIKVIHFLLSANYPPAMPVTPNNETMGVRVAGIVFIS